MFFLNYELVYCHLKLQQVQISTLLWKKKVIQEKMNNESQFVFVFYYIFFLMENTTFELLVNDFIKKDDSQWLEWLFENGTFFKSANYLEEVCELKKRRSIYFSSAFSIQAKIRYCKYYWYNMITRYIYTLLSKAMYKWGTLFVYGPEDGMALD